MGENKHKDKRYRKEVRLYVLYPILTTVISAVISTVLLGNMGKNNTDRIVESIEGITTGNITNSDNGTINVTYNKYGAILLSDDVPLVASVKDCPLSVTPNVTTVTELGYFASNDSIVYATDVVNSSSVFYYQEDNYDIFFFGMLNDHLKWDGNCVLNAYKDNKLQYSISAKYEDGKVMSFRQIHRDSNIWIFSESLYESEARCVRHYIKQADYQKDYNVLTVDENDAIYPEQVYEQCTGRLIKYYVGQIENDVFEDCSGDAHLICFGEDEKIDFYYRGCFVNGEPEDNTGTAWSLKWDAMEPHGYMYYVGCFSKGKRSGKPIEAQLSQDRIDKLVGDDIIGEWRSE